MTVDGSPFLSDDMPEVPCPTAGCVWSRVTSSERLLGVTFPELGIEAIRAIQSERIEDVLRNHLLTEHPRHELTRAMTE